MRLLLAAAVLLVLTVQAIACDEECASGFYFDDQLATCVRVTTS